MKTNIKILLLSIFISYNAFSQGLIINATNFYLTANSNLILSQNANWTNNGTVTCISTSNVKYTGNAYQYINGTTSTTFSNVVVNNSGGGVVAGQNFNILGTLTLTLGHFDLKSYTIDLSTSGIVSGENENARIRATSGATGGGSEGGNTGTIRATRDNPNGNVAGLGLDYTPTVALGNSTLIERGCNALQGSGNYNGNYSIFRWYKITPGSGTVNQITVNKFYYWGGAGNAELNGHNEADLEMFQRVQYYNGSSNPIYWEPRTTTVTAGSDYVNSTTTNNPIMLNYILVTLGSTGSLLPVEFISFTATCIPLPGGVSGGFIQWQTASETNNYGFYVQKSNDAEDWENLTFVLGHGNSNTLLSYQTADEHPFYPITYYRILQTDNDGASKYSNIIAAQCNHNEVDENITPLYNESGNVSFIIQGLPGTTYKIYLTNYLGQTLAEKKIVLEQTNQTFTLDHPFAQGMYYLSLISETKIISKPVIIP
jgi:hypothetical protein